MAATEYPPGTLLKHDWPPKLGREMAMRRKRKPLRFFKASAPPIDGTRTNFFSLPPELRNIIYEGSFPPRGAASDFFRAHMMRVWFRRSSRLLLVSRQVYCETWNVFKESWSRCRYYVDLDECKGMDDKTVMKEMRKGVRRLKDADTGMMRFLEFRTTAFNKPVTGSDVDLSSIPWTMSLTGNARLFWEHPDPELHHVARIDACISDMAAYTSTHQFRSRNKGLGVRYARQDEMLWKYLDWTVEEMLAVIAYALEQVRM